MAVKKQEKRGAPIGNKNAYVDDEKEVIELLTNMKNGLMDGTYHSLSKALLKNGIGHNSFRDYSEKYATNPIVSDIIKKVRELGEVVIESNAMEGAVNAPMAMFHLKHHYGHSDQPKQQQLPQTDPQKIIIEFVDVTDTK